MGKPKAKRVTARQRAEQAAEKKPTNREGNKLEMETVRSVAKSTPWDVRSDIFKNIEVGSAIIKDRLESFDDADVKTVITSKSFRGLNVRKKDKRKIKQTLFKQKIHLIKEAKEALKAKKKRQTTVITGDMKPLIDSLPTVTPSVEQYLTDNMTKKKRESVASTKPSRKSKMKQQTKDSCPSRPGVPSILKDTRPLEMELADIELFKQVVDHPAFKKDPTGTIQEHLDNKILLETQQSMDTTT